MKGRFTFLYVLLFSSLSNFAQNVGIGTNTPGFPLNFPNTLGDKISLYGNSGAHYGIGIQSNQLQIHTDLSSSDILFGYGSSGSFIENLRIKGTGNVGVGINNPGARLHIANGSSGYSGGYNVGIVSESSGSTYLNFLTPNGNESGVLFGKASDLASGGIVYNNGADLNGLQLRTNGNITRMVVDNQGRVGIGTTSPNAPLTFPASLGKKITLYPGATGDVGIGVSGNRLQLYADNPNADVALGWDAAGTFNERFAVKPNGALAVNGDMGQVGQMLMSNGGNTSTWQNPMKFLYDNTQMFFQTSTFTTNTYAAVPGLAQTITVPDCKAVVIIKGQMAEQGCFGCSGSSCKYDINLDGTLIDREIVGVGNDEEKVCTNGATIVPLTAGQHTFTIYVDGNFQNYFVNGWRMIIMVIPH
jgi:hypothetical protein